MKRPLLEILIATYNRPHRAIEAIDSCLEVNDDRFIVSCSSNGFEESLLYLNNYNDRLRFSYFNENRGPNENWGKLINDSIGHFIMLLSDEDKLDKLKLKVLLDWLEVNPKMAIVNCSIINAIDKSIYYVPESKFQLLDLGKTLMLYPEQTSYLSGYIFNNSYLKNIDLKFYVKKSSANVYGHINISHKLLEFGLHGFFKEFVVIKGPDDKFGGHAYEHITDYLTKSEVKLNPEVYSSFARAIQFYYMHCIIRISLPSASTWQLFLYDIDLIISFYYGVMKGNENCGFNENISNEVNRALNHAKKNGEYLPTFTSFIFKYLFLFDASNLIKILRKLLFAYRAILIRYFL